MVRIALSEYSGRPNSLQWAEIVPLANLFSRFALLAVFHTGRSHSIMFIIIKNQQSNLLNTSIIVFISIILSLSLYYTLLKRFYNISREHRFFLVSSNCLRQNQLPHLFFSLLWQLLFNHKIQKILLSNKMPQFLEEIFTSLVEIS